MRRRMNGGWKARVKNVCWADSWAEVLWYRPEKKRKKNRLFRFTHGSHIIQTETHCAVASARARLFSFFSMPLVLSTFSLSAIGGAAAAAATRCFSSRETAQPIRFFFFSTSSSFASACGESDFYVCSILDSVSCCFDFSLVRAAYNAPTAAVAP